MNSTAKASSAAYSRIVLTGLDLRTFTCRPPSPKKGLRSSLSVSTCRWTRVRTTMMRKTTKAMAAPEP